MKVDVISVLEEVLPGKRRKTEPNLGRVFGCFQTELY